MRSIARPALLALALGAICAPLPADVIYVKFLAPGPVHDGTSWATAFADLQAALAAASPGDEIWVTIGSYMPTASTDRTASFALKNGVALYGGFNGAETLRSQRNPAAWPTALSGGIGTTADADNSYHVLTADATVTASAVVDGFFVKDGHADGPAPADQRGGGLLVSGGSPTFVNLTFSNNYAADRGGAVRIESGAPTFDGCTFGPSSSGVAGGGLSSASATAIPIRNSIFGGNTTGTGRGGAIDANRVAAVNSLIAKNSPNGVYIAQDGASFINCTFTGNSAYAAAFLGGPNNSIVNSILYGDTTGEIFLGFSAGVAVSYSDVQGGGFGTGPGNLDANPLFIDVYPVYSLAAGSPAVDAGNNAAVPAGVTKDLIGQDRFLEDPTRANTGSGTPPIVDLGAYEHLALTVSAPADQTICEGAPVEFSVTAVGEAPLSYRWHRNGLDLSDGGAISGAATDTLRIDPSTADDGGSFDVTVTDGSAHQKTSPEALLTIYAYPAAPTITAPKSIAVGATGVSAGVADHAGSTYAWTLSAGAITSGQGSHQISFSAASPGTTMTLSVVETGTGGCDSAPSSVKIQVDFSDVSPSYLFHNAIVSVALAGITTGCGGGKYCPDDPVTRDAMAVFILRGEHGGAYDPPAAQGDVFADVTTTTFLAKWMEQFGREGISTGCAGGAPPPYCPTEAVTRDGMSVFLLRGKHGSAFQPPAATGAVFCDVTVSTFLAKWMEELKAESITGGCGAGMCGRPNYCVTGTVTRGEMAAFIKKTFGLP